MTDLFPDIPKTIQYVTPKDDGFPLASFGNSSIDGEDHYLSTYNLKADMVPEVLMDAKTTAEYVSELINKDLNKPDGIWKNHT